MIYMIYVILIHAQFHPNLVIPGGNQPFLGGWHWANDMWILTLNHGNSSRIKFHHSAWQKYTLPPESRITTQKTPRKING